jgi:predicted outer membrane protein
MRGGDFQMVRFLSGLFVSTSVLIAISGVALAEDKISLVFLRDMMEVNLADIQLSQLAKKQSQDADVISFAQSVERDASTLNEQAQKIAAQIGLTAPTDVSARQKDNYLVMSKLSGPSLERAFIRENIAALKAEIPRVQNEAKKKSDPIGNFASQMLPILQTRLDAAQSLHPN